MAYDEGLAQRIRERLGELPGLSEKRMFGGLAFLEHGNMLVAVSGDGLMVRVGPDATDEALARPGARIVEMGRRRMRGWVVVSPDALDEDRTLVDWIGTARAFVSTLPPKG